MPQKKGGLFMFETLTERLTLHLKTHKESRELEIWGACQRIEGERVFAGSAARIPRYKLQMRYFPEASQLDFITWQGLHLWPLAPLVESAPGYLTTKAFDVSTGISHVPLEIWNTSNEGTSSKTVDTEPMCLLKTRCVTQTLLWEASPGIQRSVTGELMYASADAFQKYHTKLMILARKDQKFSWGKGEVVCVYCLPTISEVLEEGTTEMELRREPAPESLCFLDGETHESTLDGKTLRLPSSAGHSIGLTYRPQLFMRPIKSNVRNLEHKLFLWEVHLEEV
jgi:hypothetical protein